MLQSINPTTTQAWKKLQLHFEAIKYTEIKDLFKSSPKRFDNFHLFLDDIMVDYSKNRIDEKTISLLIELANECKLNEAIDSMFNGEAINATEKRAVMHTALRNRSNTPVLVDGKDVMPDINRVLSQMEVFCTKIHSGEW